MRTAGATADPSAGRTAHAHPVGWLDVFAWVFMLAVGTARLPTPLGGDQALNLLMGELISQGGAPYLDLWDLKHVGVFLFFAVGGGLFGFDEIGIHLAELIWLLALALLVRVTAGRWLRHRIAVCLAPALTVGVYYAVAGERYLAQTEALVGLPLLASLWCAVQGARGEDRTSRWFIASGLWGGVVMVFKLPYVAIPVAFWLLAIRELASRRGERLLRTAATVVPLLAAGLLLPAVATVTFLAQKGVAAVAFWTYFRHPAEALEVTALEPRRLARAARTFVVSFAPVLALAALGAAGAVRRRRFDTMTAGLGAWVLLGLGLIVTQAISWWDYHFLLLLVPAGLLAAGGLDVAASALSSWLGPSQRRLGWAAGALGLAMLFAPQLRAATRVVADVARERPLPLSRDGVRAYQARHHRAYAAIRANTAFLRAAGSFPGPIYVIDSPVYYLHAGRWPAAPLLAPWFHPTDRLWASLQAHLQEGRASYVRISPAALQAVVDTRPALRDEVVAIVPLIEREYVVLRADEDGTWYVRRDLAARPSSRTTRENADGP
jgi:hypothetical protein